MKKNIENSLLIPYSELINRRRTFFMDHKSTPPEDLVKDWAEIHSGSDNLPGLARMCKALKSSFSILKGDITEHKLPERIIIDKTGYKKAISLGQALHIRKRPDAPIRVFLGGHMDTVYGEHHPFQRVRRLDKNTMQGPGVADMKGGLVVMLKALEILEQHPSASNIGWEVLINPDEEIGSPGSYDLFVEAAKRNHLGLLFEPSFPDGAIVSERKGSANWTVISRGKAAHAGRDFEKGKNAIAILCHFLGEIDKKNGKVEGLTINVGSIQGGGPVNIVPDLAIARINARFTTKEAYAQLETDLQTLIESMNMTGAELTLFLEGCRKPKIFGSSEKKLFDHLNACAKEIGYSLEYRPSGGVCDGNILSEHGLPVLDSLGVIGGNIHTDEEYFVIDSLGRRIQLVGTFLVKLATGQFKI